MSFYDTLFEVRRKDTPLIHRMEHIRAILKVLPAGPRTEEEIPLGDDATWDLFAAGPGVLSEREESPFYCFTDTLIGLQRFQPLNVEELAAFEALYRPGPLYDGLFDEFIRRKETGDWDTTGDESVDLLLGPTYGMVLYKEHEESTRHLLGPGKHLFGPLDLRLQLAQVWYHHVYLWRHHEAESIACYQRPMSWLKTTRNSTGSS